MFSGSHVSVWKSTLSGLWMPYVVLHWLLRVCPIFYPEIISVYFF